MSKYKTTWHDIAKAILRKEEFITEEQLIEQDKQDIQEFSRSQLDALARQYSDLKGKTISIDNANKLRKIFDKIPNHFLNDLRKKHIPFLSGLALSRMVQKGIPVREEVDLEEGVEVQITLKGSGPINKRSHVHDFKNRADAEKWIKWYKTGGSSSALMPFKKNKVDKIEIHETAVPADYLKSKLNTHQINNIKNTWKSKKASDVTPAVKAMIKKMDIPTQLAIKQANIPHLSKLIEVNELCQVGDKVKKEETMLEFTTQQIKQAYGILNDPRYKQGNYSGAVKAIEKLARGLSNHPDVKNALKRANESLDEEVQLDENANVIKGVNDYMKIGQEKIKNHPSFAKLFADQKNEYKMTVGPKYIKIHEYERGQKRSIHAFVDKQTGDLYKPAGVNAPAKGARGNVTDPKFMAQLKQRFDVHGGHLYKSDPMARIFGQKEVEGGVELEEQTPDPTQYGPDKVAKAMKIAVNSDGKYTIAVREIEKIAKNLSKVSTIARALQKANEQTISERGGANTSSRQGSVSRGAKKKYRFGYRVAEKQPTGDKLAEEAKDIAVGQRISFDQLSQSLKDLWTEAADKEKGASTAKVPPVAKDNKPGVKIAKIRLKRDKMDGPEGDGKDEGAELAKKEDEVALLKQKMETEKAKSVEKATKKLVNPETGEPLLQIGIAYKHIRDKLDKEKEKKKEEVKESSEYLKSKLSSTQIANIKATWAKKKASDVTIGVKDMIKKMDIPTQLAIKAADIPHISKLVEDKEEVELEEDMAVRIKNIKMPPNTGGEVPNSIIVNVPAGKDPKEVGRGILKRMTGKVPTSFDVVKETLKLVEDKEEVNEGYEGTILAYLKKYADKAYFSYRKLMVKKGSEGVVKTVLTRGVNDRSSLIYSYDLPPIVGVNEGVQVQVTKKGSGPENKRSHVHDFKSKADAEKWIKWYKTGGSSSALMPFEKNKVDKIEIHEIAEGFEWHTLSFLKRKGFNVARFSYGKLLVPKSDVEDVKKVLEKEYNKRDGDIFELPKKIVGESSFADLKHKSQPVEVREQFTTSQLTNLRKQWATVKTINPTGDKYKALVKWINDKEFEMVDQLARAKINFVSYIAKKALMDKWKFKKDTINKVYGGLLSNQYENLSLDKVFKEVSPPGWEGSVRAMKKHPELGGEDGKDGKNIYALAWYLKNKGAKSHYKDKGGKPVKKDKYKNEETEQHAQMISGVENEGRKETTNE